MNFSDIVLPRNLTNYGEQAVNLQLGLCDNTLISLTDIACTLREYAKLGVILGIALRVIPGSMGDRQISDYSSTLIVASLVIGVAAALFATKLEDMAKKALSDARKDKSSGLSQYPQNGREFEQLKRRISTHIENPAVASKVNELLEALFNHSFAVPKFTESQGQLYVKMKAMEQYKLFKGKVDRALYVPKVTKFWISKEGLITFGEKNEENRCDHFVPYLIRVPSYLFKVNFYWSQIQVYPKEHLTVRGPINTGIVVEFGQGIPMRSEYKHCYIV